MASEPQAEKRADLRVVQGDQNGPSEALALLENAHRVAEDTMTTARAEAERLLMSARHDAQQLRNQAREQAEREVADAGRKAEAAREQAQEEANRLVADARGEAAAIEQSRERLTAEREAAANATRELAERLLNSVAPRESENSQQSEQS